MGEPKRPRDPNQLAKLTLDIATGEIKDDLSEQKRNPTRRGRPGGLKGGQMRSRKLSVSRRKQIAKLAAKKRWAASRKKQTIE